MQDIRYVMKIQRCTYVFSKNSLVIFDSFKYKMFFLYLQNVITISILLAKSICYQNIQNTGQRLKLFLAYHIHLFKCQNWVSAIDKVIDYELFVLPDKCTLVLNLTNLQSGRKIWIVRDWNKNKIKS